MPTPSVLIVGAGFSGAALAVQLLRRATEALDVVLLNESGRMARGLAYGTDSLHHVLNVPAGNMSALPDDPENFLRYCRWIDNRWHAGSFVPRRIYGAYLDSLLAAAESAAEPSHARLQRVVGRAVRVHAPAPGQRAAVQLEDGRRIEADRIVLAFGHVAPEHPLDEALRALLGSAYVGDAWREPIAERIDREAVVVLVGAGLTALDMLISLDRAGHRGPVTMLSRRGLAPRSHRTQACRPASPDVQRLLAQMGPTLRGQLRGLRASVDAAVARGEDWRDWIGALRPHTAAWWQRLDDIDRRRFLRHAQAHWDILRHRCAPEAHAVFERWRDEGRLVQVAGRITGARVTGDGRCALALRPRGAGQAAPSSEIVADLVVNCTPASGRLVRSRSPLVASLLVDGLLVPDPLELGLLVGPDYGVIDAAGCESPWLRYVGPLLKARDWEATAIPELRQHAAALAGLL